MGSTKTPENILVRRWDCLIFMDWSLVTWKMRQDLLFIYNFFWFLQRCSECSRRWFMSFVVDDEDLKLFIVKVKVAFFQFFWLFFIAGWACCICTHVTALKRLHSYVFYEKLFMSRAVIDIDEGRVYRRCRTQMLFLLERLETFDLILRLMQRLLKRLFGRLYFGRSCLKLANVTLIYRFLNPYKTFSLVSRMLGCSTEVCFRFLSDWSQIIPVIWERWSWNIPAKSTNKSSDTCCNYSPSVFHSTTHGSS